MLALAIISGYLFVMVSVAAVTTYRRASLVVVSSYDKRPITFNEALFGYSGPWGLVWAFWPVVALFWPCVVAFQRAQAPKTPKPTKPVETKCADCVKRANAPVKDRVL